MYPYNQSLLNQKYDVHEVIKRRKEIKYSDDILTFDIEVSSAWMDPETNKLIPYSEGHDAKYWNNMKKYALPYIWQFSFNDKVYYGRDIRTFEHVLEDLPIDIEFTIFVHNLQYEFSFLINFLKPAKVFAIAPHKVIYCTFEGYENVTFRCSYIMTNLSLAQWGDQLGLPKLKDMDYITLKTPKTPLFDFEYDYAERDCEVVYLGVKEHLLRYGHIEKIPLTSTGKVREKYKSLVCDNDEYMRSVKKSIPRDAAFYKMLKYHLFQGGYTHGSRQFVGKTTGAGHHCDIRSSYPSVIAAYKYPCTQFGYIGRTLPDPKFFEDKAYIIKLHMTGVKSISWNSYLSSSKCILKHPVYDNGRVIKADDLHTIVTEQDFITICNNYTWDTIESEGTWCCRKKWLPKEFIEFVLQLYHDKTALKGIDPVRYAISKQYANSMFGMSVTSLFQSDVVFDMESDKIWRVEDLTRAKVDSELDKLRQGWNKKYFLGFQWGVWITSYARRRLWQLIESIDEDVIYCDTDSVFYHNEHDFSWFDEDITSRLKQMCNDTGIDFNLTRPVTVKGEMQPLGTLDFEPDFDRFKTLGAKKYCEERGGELFLTVSGINKGAVKCMDSLEDFHEGFIFDKDFVIDEDGKKVKPVRKLEHTYLDDMEPVKWPDGFISYGIKYGINMRPTGYKLSVPKVEDMLEKFIHGEFTLSDKFYKRKRGYFK